MNEQTVKLINELAAKLGTTADMLWGALLRQAPIEAASKCISLGVMGAVIAVAVVALKRWKPEEDSFNADVAKPIAVGVLGVVIFACLLVFWDKLPTITAGFFNPEYWALKQIMRGI